MIQRGLFGGAITAQTLEDLVDASDLRQVPDTQEVFMYPQSGESIIIEILQKVELSDPEDAIKFHFDSLAHDNSAQSFQVDSVVVSSAHTREDRTPTPICLKGLQMVPKFNQVTPDKVLIFMALFRVETKDIDLVVTFNVPIESIDGGATDAAGELRAEQDFNTFVQSLRILDFHLFA
ncbi:hypothetical protein CPB83DRAFT_873476 [Crepidotus variabilis]|uniref:Ran guanine nucleotide release factor n=1 Tax=Crepidotus variabilis TaxID=179855 RepID=A0A9P6EQP1_9AGAR|nr:hypothetical protein CPB83DRAFT_873476 [Crepidotus variabilis]